MRGQPPRSSSTLQLPMTDGPLLDEASQWAKDKGWGSIWTPALQGFGVGTSGGTATLARPHMGL
eukprot:381450-Heterocapsa_arctica.AAC.1